MALGRPPMPSGRLGFAKQRCSDTPIGVRGRDALAPKGRDCVASPCPGYAYRAFLLCTPTNASTGLDFQRWGTRQGLIGTPALGGKAFCLPCVPSGTLTRVCCQEKRLTALREGRMPSLQEARAHTSVSCGPNLPDAQRDRLAAMAARQGVSLNKLIQGLAVRVLAEHDTEMHFRICAAREGGTPSPQHGGRDCVAVPATPAGLLPFAPTKASTRPDFQATGCRPTAPRG